MSGDTPTDRPLWAKFADAVAACQPVTKDKTADAGTYSYKYTDLSSVLSVVKAACEGAGVAVVQPVVMDGDTIRVDTVIIDRDSGERLTFPGMAGRANQNPQANGSLITYARRYNLTSLFALEVDDDDGATARDWSNSYVDPAEEEMRRRVELVVDELRKLDDDLRDQMAAWKQDRSLSPKALHDDETWLAAVEDWLDEHKPREPVQTGDNP